MSTVTPSASSGVQDPSSGGQLEAGKNAAPLDVQDLNAAADLQSGVTHGSQDDTSSTAGEELLQGAQAIPEAPSETNAAATSNSSRKAKKRKKRMLRR